MGTRSFLSHGTEKTWDSGFIAQSKSEAGLSTKMPVSFPEFAMVFPPFEVNSS